MTLLAGWAALLSRLSGQDDVVIGTPAANRNRVEIERLIGFFVNMLALRLDVSDSFDVGTLLAHAKSQTVAAQEHQSFPFEQVVEIVRPPRSLAHNPVFQVMFAWKNAPKGTIDLAGLQVSPFTAVPHDISKFDLTLLLQQEGNQIVGELEYATALFERSTIERYLRYFRTLLGSMVADDSQMVDRLPMLPQEERQQLLYEWNATEVEYPRDKCVHELFEDQVEKRPGAVAVAYEDEQLTYGELNRRANRLAHYLRSLGVEPDTLVAVCVDRSLEMIVGLLAVMKAGGAYVPLDPAYPAERLRYMVEDSGPKVLLTQGHLRELMRGVKRELAVIDLGDVGWQEWPETNLEKAGVGLTAEHLAYVIYTSGSTGTPKGVMVAHRGVTNFLSSMRREPGIEADDVLLATTRLSFDIAALELYLPLTIGAQLRILGGEVLDGARVSKEIERDVTIDAGDTSKLANAT